MARSSPLPMAVLTTLAVVLLLAGFAHAEKGFGGGPPPHGFVGWNPWPKFPNGLSDDGKRRAQFLRGLFGRDSAAYDFGLIFAAPRTAQEKDDERTYATVKPLAQDLGLEINIDCANSLPSCILAVVQEFVKTSDKDILISWKHRELHEITTALGATNARIHYPDERNDVIWIMQNGAIVEKLSQHMPGLDDKRVDAGDPDLEIERPAKDSGSLWSLGSGKQDARQQIVF
ncbi:hypothetical protein RQP46_005041 [Phenoliferia psychrophenolica]